MLFEIFSFSQVVTVGFYSPAAQSYKLGMMIGFNSENIGFRMYCLETIYTQVL